VKLGHPRKAGILAHREQHRGHFRPIHDYELVDVASLEAVDLLPEVSTGLAHGQQLLVS
jgi:hypothetical protein